jgi:hypothetical protein
MILFVALLLLIGHSHAPWALPHGRGLDMPLGYHLSARILSVTDRLIEYPSAMSDAL